MFGQDQKAETLPANIDSFQTPTTLPPVTLNTTSNSCYISEMFTHNSKVGQMFYTVNRNSKCLITAISNRTTWGVKVYQPCSIVH